MFVTSLRTYSHKNTINKEKEDNNDNWYTIYLQNTQNWTLQKKKKKKKKKNTTTLLIYGQACTKYVTIKAAENVNSCQSGNKAN
jgi:hypothetical protein